MSPEQFCGLCIYKDEVIYCALRHILNPLQTLRDRLQVSPIISYDRLPIMPPHFTSRVKKLTVIMKVEKIASASSSNALSAQTKE